MKHKTLILAMCAMLFAMPSILRAEEVEIQLLLNENSRAIRTIKSTISGEKDVVTMDVNGLPNGIYFLSIKVDNEIITTSKMIIKR